MRSTQSCRICMYPPPHMTSVLSVQGSIDEINAVMPYLRFDADLTFTGTHSKKSEDSTCIGEMC